MNVKSLIKYFAVIASGALASTILLATAYALRDPARVTVTSRNRGSFVLASRTSAGQIFCKLNHSGGLDKVGLARHNASGKLVWESYGHLLLRSAHDGHLRGARRRLLLRALQRQQRRFKKQCQQLVAVRFVTPTPTATPAVIETPTATATATPNPATPTATPTPSIDTGAAASLVVRSGTLFLTSSTFLDNALKLKNVSLNGQSISRVSIDLRNSLLHDNVWDPTGKAGNDLGKPFTVDVDPGVGTITVQMLGAHDDGFDIFQADFTDFTPGKQLEFSIDIDPTDIRGVPAPGPGDAGKIAGSEMTGAEVTVQFSDGSHFVAPIFKIPGDILGGQTYVRGGEPSTLSLSVVGQPVLPATVSDENQLIQIQGPAGANARVLVAEAGLYLNGVNAGGYDLDPYEPNSVIGYAETTVTLDQNGLANVPVTLTKTGLEGGYNIVAASITDSIGRSGPVAKASLYLQK